MCANVSNNLSKIILLIFGGISILIALGLIVRGGSLFFVTNEFVDNDGFISTNSISFETTTSAIVFQPINIDIGNIGSYMWQPTLSDFITIKISGSNNDPSKNIFIGIDQTSKLINYLDGVGYSEVTDLNLFPLNIDYFSHTGHELPEDPTRTSFVISTYGSGTQSLEWEPEEGVYSIILMNDDDSSGIDLDVKFKAKVPFLNTIMMMLFTVGIIALIFGGLFIYFARGLSNQYSEEIVTSNESGKIFCTNCGKNMIEEDVFCQNCGQKNSYSKL